MELIYYVNAAIVVVFMLGAILYKLGKVFEAPATKKPAKKAKSRMASKKKKKEDAELEEEVKNELLNTKIHCGRIRGAVRDHEIVELYFKEKPYNSIRELLDAENLTSYEKEHIIELQRFLDELHSEEDAKEASPVIDGRSEGMITAYHEGQVINVGDRGLMFAELSATEHGRLFVSHITLYKNGSSTRYPYDFTNQKGEYDDGLYSDFQQEMDKERYWKEEVSALYILEDQINKFNKNRHRILYDEVNKCFEFISEAQAIRLNRSPDPLYTKKGSVKKESQAPSKHKTPKAVPASVTKNQQQAAAGHDTEE